MKTITIHTDGSAIARSGGCAAIVNYGGTKVRAFVDGADDTTNNKMELKAVALGLSHIQYPDRIEVISDSLYVVDIFTGKAKPKANLPNIAEVEREIKRLAGMGAIIQFYHVYGHSDDEINRRADRLAHREAKRRHQVNPVAPKDDSPEAQGQMRLFE